MKIEKKTILILAAIAVATIIIANRLLNKTNLTDISSENWFDKSTKWYNNADTLKTINNLHPKYRNKAAEFFTKIERELKLYPFTTSGYRSFEKQQELYNQNNQNAKPGFSSHNFGFALDMNVKDANGNNFLRKATSKQKWLDSKIVDLAKRIGLSWGGDFNSYYDPVHFYIKPNGLSTADLKAMVDSGKKDKDGYVLV